MNRYPEVSPEYEDYDAPTQGPGAPEKLLLAAVFERALRDLSSINKQEKDSAIKWFLETEKNNHNTLGFTYALVLDVLCLSSKYAIQIRKRVAQALNGTIHMSSWHISRHRVPSYDTDDKF